LNEDRMCKFLCVYNLRMELGSSAFQKDQGGILYDMGKNVSTCFAV
jgi:hypothetical protein